MQTAVTNPEGALGSPALLHQTIARFVASAAITKNRLVTISTDGEVAAAGTATPVLGVAITGAAGAGDVVDVVIHGEALVKAGASMTAGANVLVNAAGGEAKTGTAASSLNAGIALEAASDGLVRIWVNPS